MIRKDSTDKLVLEEHLKEVVLCRFRRKGIPGQGKSKCRALKSNWLGYLKDLLHYSAQPLAIHCVSVSL